jgi:ferrous iron transport protein B
MGSIKWTLGTVGYMTGFAYAISLIVYQLVGFALGYVSFSVFTILAFVVLAVLLYLIFRKGYRVAEKEK